MNIHFFKHSLIIGLISLLIGFCVEAAFTRVPTIEPISPPAPCKKPLQLGWGFFPPYTYFKDGSLKGPDPELAEAILNTKGYCLVYNHKPYSTLKESLQAIKEGAAAGGADLGIGLSYNDDRKKKYGLLYPEDTKTKKKFAYRQENVGVFISIDIAEQCKGKTLYQLLQEKIIGKLGIVVEQDYGATFRQQIQPDFKDRIVAVASSYELVNQFKNRQVDAVINDVNAMWHFFNIYAKENIHGIRLNDVLVNKDDERGVYLVVSPNLSNAEVVVGDLIEAIKITQANGTLDRIIKKYSFIPPFNPRKPRAKEKDTDLS